MGLVLLGIGLQFALSPWLDETPFLSFFATIVAATFFCGWRPAALALSLSAAAGWYFFLPPYGSFAVKGPQTFVPVIAFLSAGTCEIALVEALVRTTRRLRAATQAQETLFRELQHRVANNMQVVAAMLHRARRKLRDPAAAELLDDAEARIFAMSELHRRLYDPGAFTNGLRPVLHDMLTSVFVGLPVTVSLDIREEALSLGQLTAITLLVSEAATNAVKHVFRPEQGTSFDVALTETRKGRLRLAISDDGPGVAPTEPGGTATKTLGMGIMEAFARQLGGSLVVESVPGTRLAVDFDRGRDGSIVPA
jgi:two-component system, sensor histidine kinase PdtaS